MRKTRFVLPLLALLVAGCNPDNPSTFLSSFDSSTTESSVSESSQSDSSTSSTQDSSSGSTNDKPYVEDEFGGGEVDEEEDVVDDDISLLKETLAELSSVTKYTYDIDFAISGVSWHVTNYFGEHYFFEDSDLNEDYWFGMAEEADTLNRFYLYYDENSTEKYIPSIYEYTSLDNTDPFPGTGLYAADGLAGLNNISETVLDELTGVRIDQTSFYVTSPSCYGIFLYMTNYGSSLADSITECRVRILNAETNQIEVSIVLGDTGSVVSTLTPLATSPFDEVDTMIENGTLKGVSYNQDVVDFLEVSLSDNNYTFTPSYVENNVETPGAIDGYVTEDYFLVDFSEQYENSGSTDWGYMVLPADTTVSISGSDVSRSYSGCYEFVKSGSDVSFTNFVGPVEEGNEKYIEVDTYSDLASIPSDQLNEDYLYIVLDENYSYVYREINGETGEMGFVKYQAWFRSAGDYPIDSSGSTFYVTSSSLGQLGRYYFEKDWTRENTYFTTDSSVVSLLSNTLFGYGYFQSSSFKSYCHRAEMSVTKEADGTIESGTISLYVLNGSSSIEARMTIFDIGTTTVPELDNVRNSLIGGQN